MHSEPFYAPYGKSIYEMRYKHPEDVNWLGTAKRVVNAPLGALYAAPNAQKHVSRITELHDSLYNRVATRQFIPGGRYLYAAGRDFNQVNNCVLLRCPDSREGFADTSWNSEMALMSGAGIGVWYGDVRAAGSLIQRTGGMAGGPVAKMSQINDTGRHVIAGGDRRCAIWAGLPWWHKDIDAFISVKDWPEAVRKLKSEAVAEGKEFPAVMDKTNISVTLDDEFFWFYHGPHFSDLGMVEDFHDKHGNHAPDGGTWAEWAKRVYHKSLEHMLQKGEPGFTVDVGKHRGEVLRNACTEITSADDSDVCNLGSLVMPRFDSVDDFREGVKEAVAFLTGGSLYSAVPYPKVSDVREQNRRLGLGLIGVHEFLMRKGVKFGTDDAFEVLEPYMQEYARALEYASDFQSDLGISTSLGATAIAPTGTIGAVAESTPGSDPMFSAAEIRTVINASPSGDTRERHVVVDPTAARLVREGVSSDVIEDAYTLSLEPERRIAQQAFLQDYTDHAISSTVNIPHPITDQSELADYGETLMRYLPRLRGITFYPDGAIPGQPRNPCDLDWALENEGTILETDLEGVCAGGACDI